MDLIKKKKKLYYLNHAGIIWPANAVLELKIFFIVDEMFTTSFAVSPNMNTKETGHHGPEIKSD